MSGIVTKSNPLYPPLLLQIPDAPQLLHYSGVLKLKEKICIGIVGTRKPSQYGVQMAKYFSQAMARAGVVVVSGLAFGIDGIAHEAALDADGVTIAILGSGLDVITPSQHEYLARRIVKNNGAVVSEYAQGTPGLKHHFLARNRIIAGMSHALIVIEAPERSGALSTARQALEYNREVFCLPGAVTSETSRGTNNLIKKSGAMLVTCPEDIFEALDLHLPSATERKSPQLDHLSNLSAKTQNIFSRTSFNPTLVDEIIIKTGLPASEVIAAISHLELAGILARMGSYVVRTR